MAAIVHAALAAHHLVAEVCTGFDDRGETASWKTMKSGEGSGEFSLHNGRDDSAGQRASLRDTPRS